ncbi:MAG: hypothetical protein NC432_13055 [Roseburia sp.]|nr:hypothetical protein [Roseburia sp.]MCM1098597.1 hypothetical protein [Ruminococcus flavefaciens]MCM1233643.1 hypothetical protein [Ruminococcus flavefaciens]
MNGQEQSGRKDKRDVMINVLCIGQYNGEGKFTAAQWIWFIEWCKTECNAIIVYSRMRYDMICARLSLHCNIVELEMPDKEMDVHAYKIMVTDDILWEYIREQDYNIDIADDISHLFFFDGGRNIASLEIVDYENYILFEESVKPVDRFLSEREMLLENIRLCNKGKADVDDLLRGESWKPLGCA